MGGSFGHEQEEVLGGQLVVGQMWGSFGHEQETDRASKQDYL